jgi:polyferredoxin
MKRQKVRKGIVIISFLLFPVTLYYFSPYLIVLGAKEGIITGGFITFAAMFILSLFFGRAFCGWLCPAGGLQECMILSNDKNAEGGKLNWIKFIIWLPWLTTIILLLVNGGVKKIDFFYQIDNGISVTNPFAYIIFYSVIFLIVILSLIAGKRSFCHYVCWMAPFMILGTKIKERLKYPSLHLKADKDKCVGCKMCNKKCPMSLDVKTMVSEDSISISECILCGECIDACPKLVIKYGKKR